MTSLLKILMTFSILSSFLHAQDISDNPVVPQSPFQKCLDCFSNFKTQENIAFPTTQTANKKWDTKSVLVIHPSHMLYKGKTDPACATSYSCEISKVFLLFKTAR